MKRISPVAYQALRDALPVITWNKRPFETYLRTSLRDHPELLAGINFEDTKRHAADALVDRLIRQELKYQQVTLQLMLELASMDRYRNIEQIKDPDDREYRLVEAREAVAHLREVTKPYAAYVDEAARLRAEQEAREGQVAASRKFDVDTDALRLRFMALEAEADVRQRGYAFERLLADLFALYDLEPRFAYIIDVEQIDGAFTFDTDDYVLEARWRKEPASRADGDVFAAKVRSKGKNAVGLFVSVAGFAGPFLQRFETETPFITMDGADLFAVLDRRVRLDDLLKAKKRHSNETGSCFLPAALLA